MKAPDGAPINAAHGFLGMLARLVADHNPDYIVCATDEDWRPDWRVQLIQTYKTHRLAPGTAQQVADQQIAAQMPLIFEALTLCGIRVAGSPGYEAEDVIGTLAARAPNAVAIVSGDRDLFQLVRDPKVWVLYPRQGVSALAKIDESYIRERFGIPGRAYADYAVLRGDPSDGLPGVRGIGEKTASALLRQYGSLEAIVEAAITGPGTGALGKVKAQLDYVERAVQVVAIPRDLPLPEMDMTRPRTDPDGRVFELAERFALTNAVRRLVAAIKG